MPRKAFVADLQKAVEGVSIAGISDVKTGNDDGEFTFLCIADGQELRISVLIPGMTASALDLKRPADSLTELADYPSSHMCMIFAPDNAPAAVAASLNTVSDAATGKSIPQILELVSSRLEVTDRDGDQQMVNSQDFHDLEDDDDEFEEEYFPGDEENLPRGPTGDRTNTVIQSGSTEVTDKFKLRLRRDLLTAKREGFKVGHVGGLMEGLGCYVSIAIRIAKLGISEEAMQAWQLQPNEYLVVILHYPRGYKNMNDLTSYDALLARHNFGIRLGVSTTYKPTMQEAIQAFTVLSKEEEKRREASQANDSQQQPESPQGFRNSFISRPLNDLVEQRLPMLLKYRYSGMPWSGAEAFYNDQILQPSHTAHAAGSEDKYYEPEHVSTSYSKLVAADHIQDSISSEHSLPLVSMQFVLRHFVRCTEFCLICFSKMPDDLQAIKPYVCDNPLCLYQYMSLGFGPSIEHEILSQPKVVDLLISFCFASARLGRLRDFPTGLSLAVPPPSANDMYPVVQPYRGYMGTAPAPTQPPLTLAQARVATKVRYSAAKHELLFEDRHQLCPLNNNNWIMLRTDDAPEKPIHCRVIDTSLYPTVRLSETTVVITPDLSQPDYYNTSRVGAPSASQNSARSTQASHAALKEFRPASYHVYEQNFDDLSDDQKRQAISVLLDLIPPVAEMKKYLIRKAQSSLSSWVDRLPPAVLGILRWIIASNRACIMQVDDEDDDGSGSRKVEDRLYGMPGWAQFRFAMGAPDKERRFIHAVRETSNRLNLKYPTLFAWHGSPIQNWHSIIREGLHFNETLHGRAYGNGVYHALDVNTSMGYSQYGNGMSWSNSDLRIQQALALNEIVNAPKEFTSSSPHLVVAQLDWIQTRYLFVNTRRDMATTVPSKDSMKPHDFLEQDPRMTPRGTTEQLIIPVHAISGSRRPKPKTTQVS
jgi:ubiquitin-conjugating enzyme E2 Q